MKELTPNASDSRLELPKVVLTRDIGADKLSLQVDPCTWMYPGYPLQASITLIGGGRAMVCNKTKTIDTGTQQDLQVLLDAVKLVPCKSCGKPAFDPHTVETNRGGQCETCFMAALQKSFDEDQKAEQLALEKHDAEQKAAGATHRVTAWVHPASGGDDFQLDLYFKAEPAKKTIERELKKAGSQVLNDYTVQAL